MRSPCSCTRPWGRSSRSCGGAAFPRSCRKATILVGIGARKSAFPRVLSRCDGLPVWYVNCSLAAEMDQLRPDNQLKELADLVVLVVDDDDDCRELLATLLES